MKEDTTPAKLEALEKVPSKSSSQDTLGQNGLSAVEETSDSEPVHFAAELSKFRQFIFVATACMAMFTNQLGLGNTVGIVSVIAQSFGITNVGKESWLLAGYSLTIGTFILLGGRLGDNYGYKKMFIIGMAWYALWSLIAGLSVYSTEILFIFARVFQGMGPAITLPNALALLGTAFPNGPRKNMAFAWFGGTAPFGAIAGFTFGGLISLAWWPWVFWSQAIALAALTVFACWSIPSPPPSATKAKQSIYEKIMHLDPIGGILGVTALVVFNFAWNQAVVVGWEQPYVYVCLILGVLFGAVFFLFEVRFAKNPIIPFHAFNSDIAFVFGCTAAGWATFGIWVFYAAQLVINIRGISPLLLAAWYSPVIPSGLISALLVGKLLGRLSAAVIMVVGQVAYVVGSILLATMPVDSIYWTYFFFSVIIICVGMDSSFPAATIIFSNAVESKYQGIAASVVITIVNYSISIGLGFAGTAEKYTNRGGVTLDDKLKGYRSAPWLSVGTAGLGLVLSLIFLAKDELRKRRTAKN